jgi:hypothetical protein
MPIMATVFPEKFRKRDWIVDSISLTTARRFIQAWHYAGGASNTATYLHGLYPSGELWEAAAVGCAWWIPPTKSAGMHMTENWQGVLSLSRLVIAPGMPTNAASFLIRRSMRLIDRSRWPVLVTYADGWRGHVGTIYRAAGWQEDGQTKPERTYVRNGRMISRKAGGHTRTHAEMLALGAECVGSFSRIRFIDRV